MRLLGLARHDRMYGREEARETMNHEVESSVAPPKEVRVKGIPIPTWLVPPTSWANSPAMPMVRKSPAKQAKESEAKWKQSLPIATRCGSCTVKYKKITVYRISGHEGPFIVPAFDDPVGMTSKIDPGQVLATIRLGSCLLARRFKPVKLYDSQMEQFGFAKGTTT